MATDNFDLIRSLLKFDKPDTFYFVQLLRRRSDAPSEDKQNKYGGNTISRTVKNYYISSMESFNRHEDEIKRLCNSEGVRAYIRLNRRSNKDVALHMMENIVSYCKNGNFPRPEKLVLSACGAVESEDKSDKTWLFDLDKEYFEQENFIKKTIMECQCSAQQQIVTIPSKTGKHLIVHPFNIQQFRNAWQSEFPNIKMPDIHKDNPTILYVA